jgi:hypothetical protein
VSVLDDLLPQWGWRSAHATRVAASPAQALAALRGLSGPDLPISGALMRLRRLGRDAREPRPLLEGMRRLGLVILAEDECSVVLAGILRPWQLHGGHLPVGSAADFRAFNRPGWVRVAMAIVAEPEGAATRVRTETRIAPTDAGAARRFGRYWRVIGPFSSITRRELLATVRRRAEAAA